MDFKTVHSCQHLPPHCTVAHKMCQKWQHMYTVKDICGHDDVIILLTMMKFIINIFPHTGYSFAWLVLLWSVCLSVHVLVSTMCLALPLAKLSKQIGMPFGGRLAYVQVTMCWIDKHGHHPANMLEWFLHSGNVGFYYTIYNCSNLLLLSLLSP